MAYEKNSKQKSFSNDNLEELDKDVNNFEEKEDCRSTLAYGNVISDGNRNKIVHTRVLFFVPKKDVDLITGEVKKEIWTSCTICNKRWKYSHYKLCPNGHGIEGIPEKEKEIYNKIYGG